VLTFDEATHTYRWSGNVVPSVTQILDGLTVFRCSPEVLAAAGERGTDVHRACELDALRVLDEMTVTDEVWPYLEAFRKFVSEMKPQFDGCETLLYHPTLRYAGTRDLRLHFGRHKEWWTVDIKTAASESPTWALQTSGYALADPEGNQSRRAALMLGKDGRYKWREYKDLNDQRVFASLVTVYHWMKSHP